MSTAIITTSNAKKAAKNTANYAKDNTQTLLILAALAVGGYLIYKTVSGIGNAIEDVTKPDPDAGSGNQGTGSGSNTPPPGATISENQAQIIAAGLLEAMNRFGTDAEKIYSLLAGKNKYDFALINNAFGQERYTGIAKGPWPNPFRNLVYWLNSELDASELAKLKQIMPGVL
jgi:hypothetical protein